jgi:predicted nucleic acid-binding protein
MTTADAFAPTVQGTRTVFVDSSALFALFHRRDERHDNARAFHDLLRSDEIPYRRLVTNDYVLDEVATGLHGRTSRERALQALETVERNEVYAIEFVNPNTFDGGRTRFAEYHDIDLSFTDCVIAAHMDATGIDHVFTYDDDFDALDCTVIPHYVA